MFAENTFKNMNILHGPLLMALGDNNKENHTPEAMHYNDAKHEKHLNEIKWINTIRV